MEDIPQRMKCLLKTNEGLSYEYIDVDVPEPEGDEVLIKVEKVSICGSDLNMYKWNDVAKVVATIPFTPGHEAAGVVVKCGPDATVKLGQRIAVENHYFCGECYQCTHGCRAICSHMGQYGHGKKTPHGGCSQYSIVPSKYCYVTTKGISADECVLLEPMGVSHNAVESLEVDGEDVLIIGCGAVGSLAVGIAKALGATRVIATDIEVDRLETARKMGADVLINGKEQNLGDEIMKLTNGVGIGRICEMSGASAMVNGLYTMLRKGGHVVLVGLPKEPIHIEDPLPNFIFKSVTVKTIHGRRIYHTWKECERLVAEKTVDLHPVISHRIPMSNFEDAFEVLFQGKGCKIILDPQI